MVWLGFLGGAALVGITAAGVFVWWLFKDLYS